LAKFGEREVQRRLPYVRECFQLGEHAHPVGRASQFSNLALLYLAWWAFSSPLSDYAC
jgi:hypothetical protein